MSSKHWLTPIKLPQVWAHWASVTMDTTNQYPHIGHMHAGCVNTVSVCVAHVHVHEADMCMLQ